MVEQLRSMVLVRLRRLRAPHRGGMNSQIHRSAMALPLPHRIMDMAGGGGRTQIQIRRGAY